MNTYLKDVPAVGACIPGGSQSEELTAVGVRAYGGFDSIDDVVRAHQVDAVAVLTCPE